MQVNFTTQALKTFFLGLVAQR